MASIKIPGRLPAIIVTVGLAVGVAILISRLDPAADGGARVEVTVPKLSDYALEGRNAFDANCAECHGKNAAGSERGPPFVHKIYGPNQHADGAFYAAAMLGAVQHHWRFGNMPAQSQVNDNDVAAIIQYVRELQLANGI